MLYVTKKISKMSISMLMANVHFSTTSAKIKMFFTGLSRSVLEETVPELLSTPLELSISPAHIYIIHRTGSPYPKKLCLLKKLCPKKLCCVSTASEGTVDRITYICACDIDHSVSFWL